jgi:carboxypeptidase PM20D1
MRRRLTILTLGLAAFATVLLVRTGRLDRPADLVPPTSDFEPDEEAAAAHLAEAIRFATVSHEDAEHQDAVAFAGLHEWLASTYPRTHEALTREVIDGKSLLYTWVGREPSLPPLVLMGHMDVVPVDPGTEDGWTHPPFAGVVADGYVWGRGSLDDKCTVISIMEAVEALVSEGFTPSRTVYLAFGHDEELGGREGANVIAQTLEARGIERAALVVDEGGMITEGLLPGIADPVALVGIAEKGSLSLELSVRAEGGHSSRPPRETGIGILARAITRLEDEPFPAHLDLPTRRMLEAVGPRLAFARRLALANLWLFRPFVLDSLTAAPETAAMVRTTTAPTIFQAGVKENVLPVHVRAIVNFRIRPGETCETVTRHVREIVADPRVEVRQGTPFSTDPSPVSDPDGPGFRLVAASARAALADSDLVVAPYLVIGGTDSRYYTGRAESVLRFLPVYVGPGDLARLHGTDERLRTADLAAGARFFHALVRGSNALGGTESH